MDKIDDIHLKTTNNISIKIPINIRRIVYQALSIFLWNLNTGRSEMIDAKTEAHIFLTLAIPNLLFAPPTPHTYYLSILLSSFYCGSLPLYVDIADQVSFVGVQLVIKSILKCLPY